MATYVLRRLLSREGARETWLAEDTATDFPWVIRGGRRAPGNILSASEALALRPFIPGPSLAELLGSGPLPVEETARLFDWLLGELPSDGRAHGRLKPANIFPHRALVDSGPPSEDDPYLSPEAAGQVQAPLGPASDLYSVGLILHQALTGRAPAARPLVLGPPFARGLDDLLARLSAPRPEDRYESAEALRVELRRAFRDPSFVPCEPRTRLALPALVGRQTELDQLLNWLETGGKAQLVGPSGNGKTRLAEELAVYAEARGCRVFRARARSRHLPLDLTAELMQELGGSRPPPGPDNALRERSRNAFQRLFEGLGPALVILDDLDLASEDELEALRLARPSDYTLLLLLSRAELGLGYPSLALEPLKASDCRELVGSMAGPVDPEALEVLQGMADGNPLLLVELVRDLLIRREGSWKLAPGSVRREAPRQEALLLRRVRSLGPEAGDLLRRAAVLGREFDVELLGALGPTEALETTCQAHLLRPNGGRSLAFSHDRLREALLAEVGPEERRSLHLEASRYLQRCHPAWHYELAYHLDGAGQLEEALTHALAAARDARERSALETAELYFLIATRARPGDPGTLEELGDVRRLLGRWEPALETYCRALALRREPLARARLLGHLADVYFQSSRLEEARAPLEEALALLGVAPPRAGVSRLAGLALELVRLLGPLSSPTAPLSQESRLAVHLLDQLAYVLAFRDGFGLIWANLRSLNLTRRALPGAELGAACSSHGVALLYVPALVKRARRFGELGVRLQSEHGDAFQQAQALARLASLELFSGSLSKAEELGRLALSTFELTGGRWELFMTRYNLALGLYRQGRLLEARELALLNYQEAVGVDAFGALLSLKVLARIGPLPARWQDHFTERHDHVNVRLVFHEVRGLEHLQHGRPASAAQAYEQAIACARQLGAGLDLPPLLAWYAQALRRCAYGLAPRAGLKRRELLRRARRAVREGLRLAEVAYPAYLPRLLREAAWLALERGHAARARALFLQGLERARQLGSRYHEALFHLDLTEVGQELGWSGDHRYQALRLLGLTGRTWEVEGSGPEPLTRSTERFANLLEWGRAIANSLSRGEVIETTRLAAEQLLKCEARTLSEPYREVRDPVLLDDPEMLLPLWAEERLIGTLYLFSTTAFSDTELQVARFLAAVAGGALENSIRVDAIRDREKRFRVLFGGAGVGIALLDRSGIVREANSTLQEMLGGSLDGRSFEDCIYREDRAAFRAYWTELTSGARETFALEQRHLGPHENLLWADLRATSLGPDGSGVVISLADVSARRLDQIARFQESERRLLATEVHDAISQPLVALRFRLEAAAGEDSSGPLGKAADQTLHVLQLARSLMSDLRTPTFEDVDLGGALADYLREFEQSWDLRVRSEISPSAGLVEGVSAVFAYRMLTEACANVRRHAHASRMRVRLRSLNGRVRGTVADDGVGFDPAAVSSRRFGLKGLHERAELLGGWAAVRSRPGAGTVVSFEIPVSYGE